MYENIHVLCPENKLLHLLKDLRMVLLMSLNSNVLILHMHHPVQGKDIVYREAFQTKQLIALLSFQCRKQKPVHQILLHSAKPSIQPG